VTGPPEPTGLGGDPTGEPGGHVGWDRLADLDAGLLDAQQASAVSAHVAQCAACRSDQAALAALPGDLAALGAQTAPMPDGVAARIDAALVAEGAESAEAGASRRTSAVTVVPTLEERRAARGRRNTRVLQVAAVLVVLLGLGGVGYTLATSGGGSSDRNTASAGSASGGQDDAAAGGGQGAPAVVRSGTDYRAATLDQALGAVAGAVPRAAVSPGLKAQSQSAGPPGPEGALSASPGPGGRTGAEALAAPQALSACLDRLGLVGPALGVDLATFAGKPAAVIVLPTQGDPTHADVYAVAPSCPAGDLLAFQRVPRP
jgi:hypothetical protein